MPCSIPVLRAKARHSSLTGHPAQTARASSTWPMAGPVVPMGKNRSGSSCKQAARSRQSLEEGIRTGPGAPWRVREVDRSSPGLNNIRSDPHDGCRARQEAPAANPTVLKLALSCPRSLSAGVRPAARTRHLGAERLGRSRNRVTFETSAGPSSTIVQDRVAFVQCTRGPLGRNGHHRWKSTIQQYPTRHQLSARTLIRWFRLTVPSTVSTLSTASRPADPDSKIQQRPNRKPAVVVDVDG